MNPTKISKNCNPAIKVIGLFLLVFSATSCSQSLVLYKYERSLMGTRFGISIYAKDSIAAGDAASAAFSRVLEINDILSDYDLESEALKLSETAGEDKMVKVSQELWEVLLVAKKAWKLSNGNFDVTIGPMVQLWRRSRRQQALPEKSRVEDAFERTGMEKVTFNSSEKEISLKAPGMRLDFGGIGKGYAADQAYGVLRKCGYSRVLVDAGGDLLAGNPPPKKKFWKVAIQDPKGNKVETMLQLRNQAVATSGDLYQFVEIDGQRYSHLIDPKTGLGLTKRQTVTVIAKDATTADWAASALSIMDPEKGLELGEKLGQVNALILQLEADSIFQFQTTNFQRFTR